MKKKWNTRGKGRTMAGVHVIEVRRDFGAQATQEMSFWGWYNEKRKREERSRAQNNEKYRIRERAKNETQRKKGN